jgi:tol-pal system protein YbgF
VSVFTDAPDTRIAHARGAGRLLATACTVLFLSGCLAQQADLDQMERSLGGKITKLDQRDKELQATVKQAKADVDKLISEARARLTQEMTVLRDEDLPAIRGALDKESHQILSLRTRLDDLEDQTSKRLALVTAADTERKVALQGLKQERDRLHEELGKLSARVEAMGNSLGAMVKTIGGRLDEQEKTLRSSDARSVVLGQQLDSQSRTTAEQIMQLSRALADFKQAMHGLGEKVAQEGQETTSQSAQLGRRLDGLQSKVETDAKSTSAHLAEVNKSVGTVAKAVETLGSRFVARLDEQDQRLDQIATALQTMTTQVNAVTQAMSQLQGAQDTPRGAAGEPGRKRAGVGDEVGKARLEALSPAPSRGGVTESKTSVSGSSEPAALTPAVAASAASHSGGAGHAGAKESYERGLKKFKEGDIDAAREAFTEFLTAYPGSSLAGNAQYWLGECYYGKKQYEQAIEEFDRVMSDHPSSEKVPAALLMKGLAYLALKDRKRAATVLRQVMDGYPKSVEAGKAADKLAQLKLR